jgi:hypothetical protein
VEVYSNTLHGHGPDTGPSFRLESSDGVNLPTTVFGSGRVPHVRPSVHGPKKMGAALSNAPVTNGVKAFENTIFGPCTLGRTWGTRPGKRA